VEVNDGSFGRTPFAAPAETYLPGEEEQHARTLILNWSIRNVDGFKIWVILLIK